MILVADDAADVRRTIAQTLEYLNYWVATAGNGRESLTKRQNTQMHSAERNEPSSG